MLLVLIMNRSGAWGKGQGLPHVKKNVADHTPTLRAKKNTHHRKLARYQPADSTRGDQ